MGTSGLQVGRLVTNWNSEGGGRIFFDERFEGRGRGGFLNRWKKELEYFEGGGGERKSFRRFEKLEALKEN